jgi:two-component system chemotaxis response regulator CheY
MAYRVLIVDDSPAMRSFIRRVMQVSGFEFDQCLEAGNGEEALNVLESEWVDVILTDINMPQMNGEQFVRHLEEDDCMRSIPVLVVSTDGTEKRIHQMLSLGAKGYVTKPFTPETLREELERLLGVPHV